MLAMLVAGLGALFQVFGEDPDWGIWDSERNLPGGLLFPLFVVFVVGVARVLAIEANGKVNRSNWAAYCALAFSAFMVLLGLAWLTGI